MELCNEEVKKLIAEAKMDLETVLKTNYGVSMQEYLSAPIDDLDLCGLDYSDDSDSDSDYHEECSGTAEKDDDEITDEEVTEEDRDEDVYADDTDSEYDDDDDDDTDTENSDDDGVDDVKDDK